MKSLCRFFLCAGLLCAPAFGQDIVSLSRYAFVAGQAADIASSYGQHEDNPLMRSPDGNFGMRGIAYKSVLTAALFTFERAPWFQRHRRLTIALNVAGVGVSAFATVHNYRNR